MAKAEASALRGYDSYKVSLGDEMRGERASLGKSLLDVQRDLRIKAAHIDAIESSNPEAVPFKGFVTGYVRAYARYLGMDENEVLRRFCEESGFEPHSAQLRTRGSGDLSAKAATMGLRDDIDAVIAGSRLAAVSRAESMNADLGATLRGLGSLAVLVALIGGLGYGGWAVLQNIQRVDFAPVPAAPDVVAESPDLGAMAQISRGSAAAVPIVDAAALAAVYAAQEVALPRLVLRDGPISALDPRQAGVYAAEDRSGEAPVVAVVDEFGDPITLMEPTGPHPQSPVAQAHAGDVAAPAKVAATPAAEVAAPAKGVALLFEADAWVRVRNARGGTVHEALMRKGARWPVPDDADGLRLRAGNAGAVYVEVDGARRGPLGRAGGVVSDVRLDAKALTRAYPAAPRKTPEATEPIRSAEASVATQ